MNSLFANRRRPSQSKTQVERHLRWQQIARKRQWQLVASDRKTRRNAQTGSNQLHGTRSVQKHSLVAGRRFR